MHKYRDIHEYHDECYYCKCKSCSKSNCRDINCEFCEGGIDGSTEKCSKYRKKLKS